MTRTTMRLRQARYHALAAVALLCAAVVTTAWAAAPVSSATTAEASAVQLTASGIPTADPGFTFDPGDVLGFGQLSHDMTEVNELIGAFAQYVREVWNEQMSSLGAIVSSSLGDLGWSSMGDDMNALGAELGKWTHDFTAQMWALAESMETQPDGELVPSFCNILNVIGVDMADWANGLGNQLSTDFQNLMDGVDGFFAGL